MNASEAILLIAGCSTAAATVWLAADRDVAVSLLAVAKRFAKRAAAALSGAHGIRAARLYVGRDGRFASRGRQRRTKARCLNELPELIDVVALGLAAGASFDAALGIYCERYETMLARSFGDAMKAWKLGLTNRRDGLRRIAEELKVEELSTFVDTVIESLEFGTPLARTLVVQAQTVRESRAFAIQEQIEKAPVKMLVPTGTLILPAMLLAILGPLVASMGAS